LNRPKTKRKIWPQTQIWSASARHLVRSPQGKLLLGVVTRFFAVSRRHSVVVHVVRVIIFLSGIELQEILNGKIGRNAGPPKKRGHVTATVNSAHMTSVFLDVVHFATHSFSSFTFIVGIID
jgi:hypothetical protein